MHVADQLKVLQLHLPVCMCSFTGETVKVLYPYDAQLEDELTIEPGDIIEVENKCGKWWRGKIMGKSQPAGLFYEEFVRPYFPQVPREHLGYPVMFKEESYYTTEKPGSDLECIICQGLASDAHQMGCCGHTVCSTCGRTWKGQKNSCPYCRKSPLLLVPDARNKRYIAGLNLYCSNYDVGCDWRGSLRDIHVHLRDVCQFAIVKCKHACSEKVQRRNLQDHERNKCPMITVICCPCCKGSRITTCKNYLDENSRNYLLSSLWDKHEPITYHVLISTHYKHCPSWPMRCPNHCGAVEELTRSTLQEHIDYNCPEQVISCQFAEAGCTVRVKRKEMVVHIQLNHVLDLLSDNTEVKDENSALHIRIGDLEKVLANLQSSYNSLNKKHATLSADKEASEEQTAHLQGQCERLMSKKTALKNQCDRLMRGETDLKNECDCLMQEKADLNNQCDRLMQEKADLTNQCDCLMQEKADLNNQCDHLLRVKRILNDRLLKCAAAVVILILVLFAMIIF